MTGTSVYLNVEDAARSIAFYEALGFESGDAYKAENGKVQWVELTLGDARFSMGEIGANEDPAFRSWVDGTLGRGVIINHYVDDIEPVYEAAVEQGVEIEEELQDWEDERFFMAVDPDGYSLMFGQRA